MSYSKRSAALSLGLPLLALALGLGGCAAPIGEDVATTESAALSEDATIHFRAGGVDTTGTLSAGEVLHIDYDTNRLTACRGGNNDGSPGWSITGFYRLNGGAVSTFEAGGFSATHSTTQPQITVTGAGDLEIWFQNTSRWGCSGYDSAFGKNYHFAVAASANAPGWMGNLTVVMSRECGGGRGPACDRDRRATDGNFTFDTWSRQRAATTTLSFEVWKNGVTDFDNHDLWKQLDVRMYSRVGDGGQFQMQYVTLDQRVANNARYMVDLHGLDPIVGLSQITDKSRCPAFPLINEGNGLVKADLQYYFVVNGAELRPHGGGVFHGTFENYKDAFAVCL